MHAVLLAQSICVITAPAATTVPPSPDRHFTPRPRACSSSEAREGIEVVGNGARGATAGGRHVTRSAAGSGGGRRRCTTSAPAASYDGSATAVWVAWWGTAAHPYATGAGADAPLTQSAAAAAAAKVSAAAPAAAAPAAPPTAAASAARGPAAAGRAATAAGSRLPAAAAAASGAVRLWGASSASAAGPAAAWRASAWRPGHQGGRFSGAGGLLRLGRCMAAAGGAWLCFRLSRVQAVVCTYRLERTHAYAVQAQTR